MTEENDESFSRRFGFQSEPPITIWDDAPEAFRTAVVSAAHDKCEMRPDTLRGIICGVLRKRPDPSNWSEYPNIWDEVQRLVYHCEWFKVYDIVEALRAHIAKGRFPDLKVLRFENEINAALRELGIGWQLDDGLIQTRGDDAFEAIVNTAKEALVDAGKPMAHNELQEALKDISRRPQADTTGAIQHSMAALECIAKDATGDPKATLGQILSRHSALVPKPLDQVVDKLWGFASNNARHVREGQTLDRREAQLVVGLAASLANYLVQKT